MCHDDPKRRTWRQVLGKSGPKPTIIREPDTLTVKHLLLEDVATKALDRVAPEVRRNAAKQERLSAAREKEVAVEQRRAERERVSADAIADAILAKAGKTTFTPKQWRVIVGHLIESGYHDNLEPLARAWGLEPAMADTFTVDDVYKAIVAELKTADESRLRAALVALTITASAGYGRFTPALKEAAAAFNVDVRQVTAKAVKAFAAEKKEKAPPKTDTTT